MEPAEAPEQQRYAVADCEQRDIERDILEAIEEKDDARQEQQVVVARDHVLGPEVDVRPDLGANVAEQERLIGARNAVGENDGDQQIAHANSGQCLQSPLGARL